MEILAYNNLFFFLVAKSDKFVVSSTFYSDFPAICSVCIVDLALEILFAEIMMAPHCSGHFHLSGVHFRTLQNNTLFHSFVRQTKTKTSHCLT